jgi:hypothetical protein
MAITFSQTPLFLFYLVNASGQSYFINNQGQVQLSGLPAPLEMSPDGWEDMTIGWERNIPKAGLIRNFSLSLGFLGDGARILEYLFNRKNLDERLWLLVQRRELEVSPTHWDLVHRFYYKGEIDLTTYRWSRRRVQVNIMEGGRVKEIQANEGTTFEIPLARPEAIRVKLDGLKFKHTGNYSTADGLQLSTTLSNFYAVPLILLSTEGTSTGIAFTETFLETVGNVAIYTNTSQNYGVTVLPGIGALPFLVRFQGKIKFKVIRNDISGLFYFMFRKSTGQEFRHDVTAVVNGVSEITIDEQILLNPTEKIYYMGFLGSIVTGAQEMKIEFQPDSRLTASYENIFKGSFIKMLPPLDFFRALIGKVCGNEAFASSSLLAGSGLCFTSGDGIRGLTGAVIKESLQNLFLFWKAEKCAGIGVEGALVVLELATHFYNSNPTDILDIGQVRDLQIEPALDFLASSFKVGYPDQNYDDVNGRFETNSEQEYTLPAQRIAKPLEAISPIRADPYGIEYVRINLDGKTTTDSSSDNDTFCINIDLQNPQHDDQGVYYLPKRSAYTTITGAADPDRLYNVEELTPKRMLKDGWALTWLVF